MVKKLFISLCFLFSFGTANAQIPVTDIIHISTSIFNEVEQIAQWVNQYTQMANQIQQFQTQIDQYRQHYNAVTGSRGMGQVLTNSSSLTTSLPPDWKNTLASVKSTASYAAARANYPTFPNAPKANALYDVVASHDALTSDLYAKSQSQIADINSLMGRIDSANDPAAKQDLMNRLVSQQNTLQASQNLAALVERKQKQELEQASRAAAAEHACGEFKRSGC